MVEEGHEWTKKSGVGCDPWPGPIQLERQHLIRATLMGCIDWVSISLSCMIVPWVSGPGSWHNFGGDLSFAFPPHTSRQLGKKKKSKICGREWIRYRKKGFPSNFRLRLRWNGIFFLSFWVYLTIKILVNIRIVVHGTIIIHYFSSYG